MKRQTGDRFPPAGGGSVRHARWDPSPLRTSSAEFRSPPWGRSRFGKEAPNRGACGVIQTRRKALNHGALFLASVQIQAANALCVMRQSPPQCSSHRVVLQSVSKWRERPRERVATTGDRSYRRSVRRSQRQPKTAHLDGRPRYDHCRGKPRAPNVSSWPKNSIGGQDSG